MSEAEGWLWHYLQHRKMAKKSVDVAHLWRPFGQLRKIPCASWQSTLDVGNQES